MTDRLCTTPGCGKPLRARGYCSGCYAAKRKSGELDLVLLRNINNICPRCKANQRKRGHPYCPPCASEYERVRRNGDRDALNARQRARYAADPGRYRGYKLKQYGLTVDQYEAMLIDQSGGCAICGSTDTDLHVDHDHSCCPEKFRSCGSCVRGLLCSSCNNGLGRFKDSPDLLIKASEYVEQGKRER